MTVASAALASSAVYPLERRFRPRHVWPEAARACRPSDATDTPFVGCGGALVRGRGQGRQRKKTCENPPVVTRQTSPDGAWEATVVEAVRHFAPAAGMTTITASVRLVSTRDASPTGRILDVDTGGRDYMRPFLTWTAPDILKVTVAKAPVEVMALGLDGVHMDSHVDLDAPVIKAAVAERYRGVGLPPEPERKDGGR